MSERKERMTVTIDRALIEAANEAVASGQAPSLSMWVNTALAERVAKERRLRALAEAIKAYEAEFGEISEAEVLARQRADERTAISIRPSRKQSGQRRRRKAA